MPLAVRLLVCALLLCGTVAAQSHALNPAHESHEAQHCCELCHFGPLPFVMAGALTAPLLAPAVSWLDPGTRVEPDRDVLLATSSSRAPPTY
ncbi:MAG TPA: hypothetical protein VMU19_05725 [Bryobacteraceae bacterium]|nr:hypothetical protein [Bryobacteraceae bacterium]